MSVQDLFSTFSQHFRLFIREYFVDVDDCVRFGADPNKNPDLVDLNVVSEGDCWSLAEVCGRLIHISGRVIDFWNCPCIQLENICIGGTGCTVRAEPDCTSPWTLFIQWTLHPEMYMSCSVVSEWESVHGQYTSTFQNTTHTVHKGGRAVYRLCQW